MEKEPGKQVLRCFRRCEEIFLTLNLEPEAVKSLV